MTDRGSCGCVRGGRKVGRGLRFRLGAPPHGDRLLDEVRVVQLEVADFLGDVLADGLGLEMGNKVGDESALFGRLKIADLLWTNDGRLDRLVGALLLARNHLAEVRRANFLRNLFAPSVGFLKFLSGHCFNCMQLTN